MVHVRTHRNDERDQAAGRHVGCDRHPGVVGAIDRGCRGEWREAVRKPAIMAWCVFADSELEKFAADAGPGHGVRPGEAAVRTVPRFVLPVAGASGRRFFRRRAAPAIMNALMPKSDAL